MAAKKNIALVSMVIEDSMSMMNEDSVSMI